MKKTEAAVLIAFLAVASFALVYFSEPSICHSSSNAETVNTIPDGAVSISSTPTVSIIYPANGTVVEAPMGGVGIGWQYPANVTFSWVGCSLNGGGNTTVTGKNETYYIENNGDYTFTLYANDTAGNWTIPQTVTFHVQVLGDALPENTVAVIAFIALILAVLILFVLTILVAYRRASKNHKIISQIRSRKFD